MIEATYVTVRAVASESSTARRMYLLAFMDVLLYFPSAMAASTTSGKAASPWRTSAPDGRAPPAARVAQGLRVAPSLSASEKVEGIGSIGNRTIVDVISSQLQKQADGGSALVKRPGRLQKARAIAQGRG
jgi:hypothetical protein